MAVRKFVYQCSQCGTKQEFDLLPRTPPSCCGVLMKRL